MKIPERRMPKRVYAPLGRCMYCDSDGGGLALTTEHIIPGGLGGRLELPESSCQMCQELTQDLERRVLREF